LNVPKETFMLLNIAMILLISFMMASFFGFVYVMNITEKESTPR